MLDSLPHQRGRHADSGTLRRVLPGMLPGITEYFAAALSGTADGEPDWNELKWRIARAVVVIHGISPLLSRRLTWVGPPGWHEFIVDQRIQTASRYQRMAGLLAETDAGAIKAGIAFVPLKGAALHAMGLYTAGERPMADIDLLVRPQDLQVMNGVLTTLGYRAVSATAEEHVMVPVNRPSQVHLSEHADNGITVEIHTAIRWPMPVRMVNITPELWPVAPPPGRNEYPSLAALMGHLLMHVAVNMQTRILRMVQLHDIALLAPRLSAADWSELLNPGKGRPAPWWAMPPLRLTKRYYAGAIPDAAIAAVERSCPRLLRISAPRLRLSDVSASNARRPILPALFWAGSWSEALGCVSQRFYRGTQAVRGAPGTPDATELQPWITRSHRRRLFDVLLGQPRPETIMMITAALNGELSTASTQKPPNAA